MPSCVVLLCLVLASPALADAISVSVDDRVMKGRSPVLTLRILEPIAGFVVVLEGGPEKVEVKGSGKPGSVRTITLPQRAEGVVHWKGALSATSPSAAVSSMALEFDTEVLGPLRITVAQGDLDFEHRVVTATSNRAVVAAHLKVMTETGELAIDADVPVEPTEGGFTVRWGPTNARPMTVDLRAFDAAKVYDSVELTTWQVAIPHEEVNFDSGKAEVRDEERPKLEASYQAIAAAVAKYGRLARITLFIAGHTDTVGSSAANRALSLDRARAIGQYFRKKGLAIPVRYEGFGEEALLVATPDETPELKNRRAEYIIAIANPTTTNVPFEPRWRTL